MKYSRYAMFLGLAVPMLIVVLGCGRSVEYFDEMQMLPVKEELVEFFLGHHGVPVPSKTFQEGVPWTHGNKLYIAFDLHALISPSHTESLTKAWKRQECSFRNDVIKACRCSSLDELTEPDLITLKGQLTELTTKRLGGRRIRRLVLTNVSLQLL